MRNALNKTLLASSILLALGSQAAFATNGLAPTGIGMEHRSMGGAAAGYAANTMSMGTNPASASFINDGYDVGLELFKPNRYSTRRADSVEFAGNEDSVFPIPEAGYKRQLNDKVSVGVAAYGNGGMNTSYATDPYGGQFFVPRGGPAGNPNAQTGVDYKQLFISPTVSYKVSENSAIGLSANLVYHEFKGRAGGIGMTNDGSYSTDSSSGIGATVGWQGKISPNVSAGISYRAKTDMGKLDKYSNMFPNGIDVPAATTAGIAWQASPKTLVAADVQQIAYSDVKALGPDGFGWDDQIVYKLGVKHQASDKLAVMGGVNFGEAPLKSNDTTLGALAPATVESHLSLGTEIKVSPKAKVIASYVHAFDNEIKGDGTALGAYDLKMDQDAVGIAYSVEF